MPHSYRLIKTRLALMMFLQYIVMGAIWPIISLYLKQVLGFTGQQAGVILAMSAVAAFIAPVVGSCIADRLISAERLLSLCHFLAAGSMIGMSVQTHFITVLVFYLAYTLSMGPTVPLTNAITFHHAPTGQRKFGHTRVWGTLAWVVVAWGFGYGWLGRTGSHAHLSRLPDALTLSALASLTLGFYSLTLPRVDKRITGPIRLFPRESLAIFRQSQVQVIAVVSLLVGIIDRYYYFGTAPFLKHLGYAEGLIMPLMSAGQITEILGMYLLAPVLAKLGTQRTLLLGLLAEIGRFSAFAWGTSPLVILLGNACHGLAYTFYFTAVYITLDSFCDRRSRTGLHQLFTIITSGFGALCANLLGGACMDYFVSKPSQAHYQSFWLVPMALAIGSVVIIACLFKEQDRNIPEGRE